MRTRRPYDPEERDPRLAAFRRTAIRLHPRPGDPAAADSSVGGPLLWPAGEAWPVCEGAAHDDEPFATVAVVRRERWLVAARNQAKARGADPGPIEESLVELRSARRERSGQAPSPQPLVGVAQLYARDAPGLPYPDGTDLLQILWCPYSHPDDDDLPLVRVVWRASGAVGRALADPSPDTMVGDYAYVPQPCTVSPEALAEYPPTHTAGVPLPPELRDYDDRWSLVDGWKAGGWGNYCGYTDPEIPPCSCGEPTLPLFTVGNGEWSPEDDRWRPDGEAAFTPTPEHPTDWDPVRTHIGRAYILQIFRCATGFDCPPTVRMT